MGFKVTFKDKAVNATYQDVTGTTNSVAGTGAKFDVTKTDGVYTTVLDAATGSAGSGYVVGDTIILAGTSLGGLITNNEIVTVTAVDNTGKITKFATSGDGRVGDGITDMIIDVDGTAGTDTFHINADAEGFVVSKGTSKITVTNPGYGSVELNLNDHERIEFNDKGVAYDITGNAGKAYSILAAAFGQTDVTNDLVGKYLAELDAGKTLAQVSQEIVTSDAFVTDSHGSSNTAYVKNVWKNVVGTDATDEQVTEFVGYLTDGTFTQSSLLELASTLDAFHTNIGLVGLATTGIEYTVA